MPALGELSHRKAFVEGLCQSPVEAMTAWNALTWVDVARFFVSTSARAQNVGWASQDDLDLARKQGLTINY